MILRLRGGGCETTRNGNEVSTQTSSIANEEPSPRRSRRQAIQPLPPVATSLWRRFLSWRISDDCLSFRILFLTVNVNFLDDISENPVVNDDISDFIPILRLRGGGPRLRAGSDNPKRRSKTAKPPKIALPDPKELCKDLMNDFDQLMTDYRKALGPCGTATCPINYNVLEDQCKKVCEDKICPEPYCPPLPGPCLKPLCPQTMIHSGSPEDEDFGTYGEDDWELMQACYASCVANRPDGRPARPCGRSVCPFGKSTPHDECPAWVCPQLDACKIDTCVEGEPESTRGSARTDPLKDHIKCSKRICPYKRDQLTVDDVNPFNRNTVQAKKGCGSPFCPHANKFKVDPEVIIPAFPCKKPCPSLEELPPIHWDCPDPLPQGECTNPFCPFREKLPCGHCPIDARHCGMPGCQFAGESLCPPTCPYTQKNPPKDLECTPSVCPLVRPADYVQRTIGSRKDKPCHDQCPYATGIKKKSCGNPECPYKTCIDDLGSNAPKDCGNPCCPYRIAAKKLEQREKERAAKKELEGTFIPLPDSSHVKLPPLQTADEDDHKLQTSANEIAASSSKKIIKKSAVNLIKLMKSTASSLHMHDVETSTGDACKEISCQQFLGDKVCKKCLARQREAQALGMDLITLEANKAAVKKSGKTKKGKKKKPRGYVYDKGTYYPGVKFGHKDCSCGAKRVPWDMGWRWNITPAYTQLRTRPGWRPGAIGKTMLKFINRERKKLGLPPRPMIKDPLPKRRSTESVNVLMQTHRTRIKGSRTNFYEPKPTLTVKKKDGVVYVTMNPLKDPAFMHDNEYPYVDCSPLEFRITKKKPDTEFANCLCTTDNPEGIPESVASSELDIEYTPPAGIVRPELMARNKHFCHSEAQYNQGDFTSGKPKPKDKGKGKKGKGKKGKGKKGKKGKKKGKK